MTRSTAAKRGLPEGSAEPVQQSQEVRNDSRLDKRKKGVSF